MTGPAGPLAGRRVLVVDEQEDALELTRLILTHGGAHVTTCRLPEEAIPLLASAPFDALITNFGFGEDPTAESHPTCRAPVRRPRCRPRADRAEGGPGGSPCDGL